MVFSVLCNFWKTFTRRYLCVLDAATAFGQPLVCLDSKSLFAAVEVFRTFLWNRMISTYWLAASRQPLRLTLNTITIKIATLMQYYLHCSSKGESGHLPTCYNLVFNRLEFLNNKTVILYLFYFIFYFFTVTVYWGLHPNLI